MVTPGFRREDRFFRRFTLRNKQFRSDKGGVIVEAAIVIPLLALFMAAMADLMLASTTYMSVSQIAREQVIMASQIPCFRDSTTGSDPSAVAVEQVKSCFNPGMKQYTGSSKQCADNLLIWRFWQLINSHKARLIDGTIEIEMSKGPAPDSIITVRVKGDYNPMLFFFKGVSISASAKGNYLDKAAGGICT